MISLELKKGLFDTRMMGIIVVSLILFFLSDYASVFRMMTFADLQAPDIIDNDEMANFLVTNGFNKYHVWMKSFDYMAFIFPLLAVIPYASTYLEERESKHYYFICSRISGKRYMNTKYIVNLLIGGLALFIPELLYYILITIIFQNEILDPFFWTATGMFSEIFPVNPELAIWLTFLTHFLLGACFAGIAMTISSFMKRRVYVYVSTLLVYIVSSLLLEAFFQWYAYSPLQWYQVLYSHHVQAVSMFPIIISIILVSYILFILQASRVQHHG